MSKAPIRKDKLRHNAIQLRGPLWVPPSLKEKYKEYHLAWVGVSDRDSYTISQYISLGYDHVTKADLDDSEMGESNLSRVYTEGNVVCTATGADTKAYLMKIPLELHNEFLESEEQRIKDRRRSLNDITKEKGVYGSIQYGDEDY